MLCFTVLFYCISNAGQQKGKAAANTPGRIDSVNYVADVLPLLQKKCSPCHFPGGKMYEKMPFDNIETIISHEAGVLKRFKEEKEIALIKKLIKQDSY
jgi:hypothetical protein